MYDTYQIHTDTHAYTHASHMYTHHWLLNLKLWLERWLLSHVLMANCAQYACMYFVKC